jgi:hypothetical protein
VLVRFLTLCQQGVRRPAAELRVAEAILGRLVVEDWRTGNAEHRALRVARRRHPTQAYFPEVLPPLFDPVLISVDARGAVLVGTELQPLGSGEVARVQQRWWLRPVEMLP